MGRFKLSDVMPNSWFYKLKGMGRSKIHHNSNSNSNRNHSNHHPLLTTKKKQQPFTATPPQKQTHLSCPRNSYYFPSESIKPEKFSNSPVNPKASDTHFPDSPKRSSSSSTPRRRTMRRAVRSSSKLVSSSVADNCSCRAKLHSVWTQPGSTLEDCVSLSPPESSTDPDLEVVPAPDPFDGLDSWSSSCSCTISSSATDIIIEIDQKPTRSKKFNKIDGFDSTSKLELPPILTKPTKFNDMISNLKKEKSKNIEEPAKSKRNSSKLEARDANAAHGSLSVKIVRDENVKTVPVRKSSASSPGVKLRANSPRLASKKIQAYSRKMMVESSKSSRPKKKSISGTCAVVKSSFDPQRDFRESMVEMIVENNIRASKDLEELLACYLSLNSNEYHDIIVKVFKQIWFDLNDTRL